MKKKILKYAFLIIGLIYYVVINIVSYTIEPYATGQPIGIKIGLSVLALLILALDYVLIINPKLISKKETKIDTVIPLYVGVLIIPLISLIIQ